MARPRGHKLSEETKQKISRSKKGQKYPPSVGIAAAERNRNKKNMRFKLRQWKRGDPGSMIMIPKHLKETMGIDTGDTIRYVLEGDRVYIEKDE